jgi:hypothetical protein
MRFQTKSQETTTATAGRTEEKRPVERVDLTYSSTYPGRGHGKRKRQTVATEPGDSTTLHIGNKSLAEKLTSIPSSTSTVVSNEEEDSMDKTPSGPTLSMASAIMVPTKSSFPAEIVATAAHSNLPLNSVALLVT